MTIMHFAAYYRWLVYRHLFGIPDPDTTLLDVGCGDTGFTEQISARTSIVLDMDIARLRRVQATARICADGTRIPLNRAQFDLVILSDVIEHVVEDAQLVANVTQCVKPGGTLWLSTTASDFALFPPQITERAERSWGHVRKGYTPTDLVALIGGDFDCDVVEWPEIVFRHVFAVMRLVRTYNQGAARSMAEICFLLDRHIHGFQYRNGHIYIRAIRRNNSTCS